jgi:hypothetical protein
MNENDWNDQYQDDYGQMEYELSIIRQLHNPHDQEYLAARLGLINEWEIENADYVE